MIRPRARAWPRAASGAGSTCAWRRWRGTGSLRGVFTGASFDGTGRPSLDWMTAEDNDLGLVRLLDARERAVSSASPAAREAALAEALVVTGALLHLVQDAGEPALVHGDYRVEFKRDGGP